MLNQALVIPIYRLMAELLYFFFRRFVNAFFDCLKSGLFSVLNGVLVKESRVILVIPICAVAQKSCAQPAENEQYNVKKQSRQVGNLAVGGVLSA